MNEEKNTLILPLIFGCGRSGTTLLGSILNSHPDLAVAHEARFLVPVARRRKRYERGSGFEAEIFLRDLSASSGFRKGLQLKESDCRAALTPDPRNVPEAVGRIFGRYARKHGKRLGGDKTPNYVFHLRLLAKTFPNARFVHIIRDGRDVALSLLEMPWGPSRFDEAAYYWKRRVELGRRTGSALGADRYHEILYEDLVSATEEKVRGLCRFLGIPFDSSMLRYYEHPETLSLSQRRERQRNVRRPPTRALREWQTGMPSGTVRTFELIAGDLLDELGYERATPAGTLRTKFVGTGIDLRFWLQEEGRRARGILRGRLAKRR